MKCRHCQHDLILPLVDLGVMPPSNAYLSSPDQFALEKVYPLKVWVCQHCWLVQTEDFTKADELFTADYAYFSSTSTSWLAHAKQFAENSIRDLELNTQSFVVEIASNDGYLLRNYLMHGIPCVGIEPTQATAEAARKLGIEVVSEFFTTELSEQMRQQYRLADLIIANNVLAHVPDINDFAKGIKTLLAAEGLASIEFPHLLNLIQQYQFDTIYHEHYSYLSLHSVQIIFSAVGLRIANVEKLSTHGGSLRVWLCHDNSTYQHNGVVSDVLAEEQSAGLQTAEPYLCFQKQVEQVTKDLKSFVAQCKKENKTLMAYGAAAKGNTLLNYAGITVVDIPAVFDAALSKQEKFMPGSHIPILPPSQLTTGSPDYLLILPWNISHEIMTQLEWLPAPGTKFVTAIPELRIL